MKSYLYQHFMRCNTILHKSLRTLDLTSKIQEHNTELFVVSWGEVHEASSFSEHILGI